MAKTTFTSTGGFLAGLSNQSPRCVSVVRHVKGWRFLASAKRRRWSQAMSLQIRFSIEKNPWKLGENKLPTIFRKHLPTNEKTKILNIQKNWMFFFGRCFSFFVSGGVFRFHVSSIFGRDLGIPSQPLTFLSVFPVTIVLPRIFN